MARTVETLSTINSFVRTLLALVVVGAVGAGGWWGYSTYHANDLTLKRKQKDLDEAKAALNEKQRELAAALEAERWRSAAMAQDFAAYKQAQSNRIAYLEVCAIWGSRFRGFRVQGLL